MTMEPTPEQFEKWLEDAREAHGPFRILPETIAEMVADTAYAAGADAELEACCEWLSGCGCPSYGREFRAARRPKPPSMKQQAMEQLPMVHYSADAEAIVMKALESLPDD